MNEFKQYLDKDQLQQWQESVGNAQKIVLLGHVSPDGDAIGSTLGMASYLKHIGKTTAVIVPNMLPNFLTWLPGADDIIIGEFHPEIVEKKLQDCDLIMLLDLNDPTRLDRLTEAVTNAQKPFLVIDHHLAPKTEGISLLVSDPAACSTCEIVFSLLWQLGAWAEMDTDCATCIYCGMMTDTGALSYNSHRPEIFAIISELLKKGIDKDAIYRNVYYTFSIDRLRLQGYVLYNKTQFFEEGRVAVFALSREELQEFNFRRGDAEGLINLPLQVKETVLTISLREDLEADKIRVSIRSIGNIPCNLIAQRFFNGGGHANAAGGTLNGMKCDQAIEIAKQAIAAFRDTLPATDKQE